MHLVPAGHPASPWSSRWAYQGHHGGWGWSLFRPQPGLSAPCLRKRPWGPHLLCCPGLTCPEPPPLMPALVFVFVWKALHADSTGSLSAICNRKHQHRTACVSFLVAETFWRVILLDMFNSSVQVFVFVEGNCPSVVSTAGSAPAGPRPLAPGPRHSRVPHPGRASRPRHHFCLPTSSVHGGSHTDVRAGSDPGGQGPEICPPN